MTEIATNPTYQALTSDMLEDLTGRVLKVEDAINLAANDLAPKDLKLLAEALTDTGTIVLELTDKLPSTNSDWVKYLTNMADRIRLERRAAFRAKSGYIGKRFNNIGQNWTDGMLGKTQVIGGGLTIGLGIAEGISFIPGASIVSPMQLVFGPTHIAVRIVFAVVTTAVGTGAMVWE